MGISNPGLCFLEGLGFAYLPNEWDVLEDPELPAGVHTQGCVFLKGLFFRIADIIRVIFSGVGVERGVYRGKIPPSRTTSGFTAAASSRL